MAEKKVVDIIVPQEEEKSFSFQEKIEKLGKKKRERLKKPELRPSAPKFVSKGKVWASMGAILVLILVVWLFSLAEAKIEIWPKTETLSFKTKVTVDRGAETVDFQAALIPGEVFEKEKTITEKFAATGVVLKEGKAQGTITVYNEYSTYDQVLVATTRFVSSGGQLFRTPTRVTIPGGKYEGGKFVPGEIEIEVVADQPGEDYNIGPSTFSIPGFAGTDRYTKFYAKSFEPMTGGSVREVTQVTKEDLEKAENTLNKKAKRESEEALLAALEAEGAGLYYIKKSLLTEMTETLSLARVGEETETFNFQAKAKSEVLTFQQKDLEDFVKNFILSQIEEDKTLYEPSLKIEYDPETVSLETGKVILSLEISGKSYSSLELTDLKQSLQGKSLLETKIFLENQAAISKTRIELWPFWVRKVPKDMERIELQITVD